MNDRNPTESVESLQLEQRYLNLVQKARTYRDIKVLTETADEFYRLGTYKDSLQMAQYCLARAEEEEKKRIEEAKVREAEEQRKMKGRKLYRLKLALIFILITLIIIAITLFMDQFDFKPYFSPYSFH